MKLSILIPAYNEAATVGVAVKRLLDIRYPCEIELVIVNDGARSLLLKAERQKFLGEEWPRIQATIQRLGLKAEELLASGIAKGER